MTKIMFEQGDRLEVTFEEGRDGSPITRVNGKISFPERGGKLPKVGETWEVELAGTNPKGTVHFLRLNRRVGQVEEIRWSLSDLFVMVVRQQISGGAVVEEEGFDLNPATWHRKKAQMVPRSQKWEQARELSSKNVEAALTAGCPPELITEAEALIAANLEAEAQERAARKRWKAVREEAVRGAMGATEATGGIPLIVLVGDQMKGLARFYSREAADDLRQKWPRFEKLFVAAGGNEEFRWGTVPKDHGYEAGPKGGFQIVGESKYRIFCSFSPEIPSGLCLDGDLVAAAREAGVLTMSISGEEPRKEHHHIRLMGPGAGWPV